MMNEWMIKCRLQFLITLRATRACKTLNERVMMLSSIERRGFIRLKFSETKLLSKRESFFEIHLHLPKISSSSLLMPLAGNPCTSDFRRQWSGSKKGLSTKATKQTAPIQTITQRIKQLRKEIFLKENLMSSTSSTLWYLTRTTTCKRSYTARQKTISLFLMNRSGRGLSRNSSSKDTLLATRATIANQ